MRPEGAERLAAKQWVVWGKRIRIASGSVLEHCIQVPGRSDFVMAVNSTES
jgi:hypothetical protein